MKEEIKIETELLRYLVLIGIALGSGTMSVIIGGLTGIRVSLVAVGIPGTVVMGVLSWLQYIKIRAMIRNGGSHESD